MKLHRILLYFTTVTVTLCSSLQAKNKLNDNSANEIILAISKLQSKHLTLLVGHSKAVPIGKHKDSLSTDWAKELELLNAKLVKLLEVDSSIFDYKGILSCGRISRTSRGYMIELFRGEVGGGTDEDDTVLGRHIVYFSDQGVITSIGKSISLKK